MLDFADKRLEVSLSFEVGRRSVALLKRPLAPDVVEDLDIVERGRSTWKFDKGREVARII